MEDVFFDIAVIVLTFSFWAAFAMKQPIEKESQ